MEENEFSLFSDENKPDPMPQEDVSEVKKAFNDAINSRDKLSLQNFF